jgi:hypothetical protein
MSASYTTQAPHIEAAGTILTDRLTALTGQPLDTAQFAPTITGQSLFGQQAQQRGATQAGLGTLQRDATGRITGFTGGTGIASYEPYLQAAETMAAPSAATISSLMSPYQQNVLDTTLAEINRSYDEQEIAQASKAGNQFGGDRFGVLTAEMQRNRGQAITDATARLSQAGYESALGRAQQQFQNQMNLAQGVPQLQQGQIAGLAGLAQDERVYQQSLLDAQAQAGRMAAMEPYERYGFFGEQLTGLSAGVPTSTRMMNAPATPLSVGLGIAGLGTSLLGSVYHGSQRPPTG